MSSTKETSTELDIFRNLGPVLKLLRLSRGFSQRRLSQECQRRGGNVTQAMLSLFENQRQKPTLQSLDVLVRSLGCPISTFAIVLQEYEKLKHCRVENIEDLIPLAGLHSLRTHLVEMLWLRVRRLEERLEVLVPGSMAGTPVDLETESDRGSELGAGLASHGNGSTN